MANPQGLRVTRSHLCNPCFLLTFGYLLLYFPCVYDATLAVCCINKRSQSYVLCSCSGLVSKQFIIVSVSLECIRVRRIRSLQQGCITDSVYFEMSGKRHHDNSFMQIKIKTFMFTVNVILSFYHPNLH